MTTIAIIGAGLSGLTLAHELNKQGGLDITVFEKSRGVSGRMTTRYADPFQFDHGAQYFTARSSEFQTFLAPLIEQGVVQEWQPKVMTLAKGEKPYKRDWFEPHYVAAPKMNALCKHMAEAFLSASGAADKEKIENLFPASPTQSIQTNPQMNSQGGSPLRSGCRSRSAPSQKELLLQSEIAIIEKDGKQWRLTDKNGESLGHFDWVISSAPAAQAHGWLPECFAHHNTLASVKQTGNYTLMLGFDEALKLGFDAAKVKDSSIGWLALNSHKPNRETKPSLLVQSTAEWAEAHIDEDVPEMQNVLMSELRDLLPALPEPSHIATHRWRYADTEIAAGEDISYLLDSKNQLAAIGDWCLGGRVENAFLSGHRLAKELCRTAF